MEAYCELGFFYANGIGELQQDDGQAFQMFLIAAQKNNIPALYNLGLCYKEGVGVEANYQSAAQAFQSAADGGDGDALYQLGILYLNGP